MKAILCSLLLIFIYSGCSNKSMSVCSLQNEYNQFKYLKINSIVVTLNTIKGTANKETSKKVYIYELTKKFEKKVNDYFRNLFYEYIKGKREILTANINQYFYQANRLINNETNQTIVKNKFHLLSKKWIEDYQKNLSSQLEGNLLFSEYDGCSDNSRKWRNSFFKFTGTPSPKNKEEFEMYQHGYEDCLRGSIKKYNADIKEREKKNAK